MNTIKSNTPKPEAALPRSGTTMLINTILGIVLPASCACFFILDYSENLSLLTGLIALGLNLGLLCTVRFNKHCTEREKLTAAVIGVVSLGCSALLTAAFAALSSADSWSVVSSAICMAVCAFCYAFIGLDLYKAVRSSKSAA